jgi:hypothetical protein
MLAFSAPQDVCNSHRAFIFSCLLPATLSKEDHSFLDRSKKSDFNSSPLEPLRSVFPLPVNRLYRRQEAPMVVGAQRAVPVSSSSPSDVFLVFLPIFSWRNISHLVPKEQPQCPPGCIPLVPQDQPNQPPPYMGTILVFMPKYPYLAVFGGCYFFIRQGESVFPPFRVLFPPCCLALRIAKQVSSFTIPGSLPSCFSLLNRYTGL